MAYDDFSPPVNAPKRAVDVPDSSELMRGLRGGANSFMSGINNAMGGVAQPMGYEDFAQGRFKTGKEYEQQAQAEGPSVASLRDIHSVGDAAKFGMGALGQMAIPMAVGVGSGLLARSPGKGLALATAAMTPEKFGHAVGEYRNTNNNTAVDQNTAMRLGGTATAASAIENIVPVGVGSMLRGSGAAANATRGFMPTMGRAVATDIGGNALASGAADTLTQVGVNPDRPVDMARSIDAAATGGVMGVPFVGARAVGYGIHSAPRSGLDGIKDMAGSIKDRVMGTEATTDAPATTGYLKDIQDATTDGLAKVNKTWDATKSAVREGAPEMTAASDKAAEYIAKNPVTNQIRETKDWIKGLMDSEDTPADLKAHLGSLGKGLLNRSDRVFVATAKFAQDLKSKAKDIADAKPVDHVDALNEISSRVEDPMTETMAAGGRADPTLEATAEGQAKNDATAFEWAKTKGEAILKAGGLTKDNFESLTQALQNVENPAAQKTIAIIAQGVEKAKGFGKTVADFGKALDKHMAERSATIDETKKSEDYSGMRAAISEHIVPWLQKNKPEALSDRASIDGLADNLRKFIVAASDHSDNPYSSDAAHAMTSIFGKDTITILSKIHDSVGAGDMKSAANFLRNVNEMESDRSSSKTLIDFIAASAQPGKLNLAHAPDLTHELIKWANTEHAPNKSVVLSDVASQRAKLENTRMVSALDDIFGDKADGVEQALKAHVLKKRDEYEQQGVKKAPLESETSEAHEPGTLDKDGEWQGPEVHADPERVIVRKDARSRAPDVLVNPDLHKASGSTEKNWAEQAIKDAQVKYGQSYDVRWVSGEELTKLTGREVPGGKDGGHIVAEREVDPERITPTEQKTMLLDAKRYNSSKSRINATTADGKPLILDAVGITKTMLGKIRKNEGETFADLEKRAFLSGTAELMREHGKFEIPAETVISYTNGGKATFGEINKLGRAVEESATSAGMTNVELKRAEALHNLTSPELMKHEVAYGKELDRRFDAMKDSIKAELQGSGLSDRAYKEKFSQMMREPSRKDDYGIIEMEKALSSIEQVRKSRTTKDETADPSKDAEIHEAASRLKPDELKVKSNMDGSPRYTETGKLSKEERDLRKNLIANILGWGSAKNASEPAKKISARADVLMSNVDKMTINDRRQFLDLVDKSAGDASALVNKLAKKYADVIVAPKGEPLGQPVISADGGKPLPVKEGTATDKLFKDAFARIAAGVEGTPDPKLVAAKKAALVEEAASGNKDLLKELSASDDAKGLQRAVEVLAESAPESKALAAANERLAALVQDPATAYGMQTTKYSLMGTRVHEELGREGFAATHDSPIRHEGKFDWRAHQGKGEGNASFGAGTYLSTAEGVHKSYKDQFTARSDDGGDLQLAEQHRKLMASANAALAEFGKRSPEYAKAERLRSAAELAHLESVRLNVGASPTYETTVNIKPEQLLDWGKPLSKQSADVRQAFASMKEHLNNQEDYPLPAGFDMHSFDGAPSEAVWGTGENTYRGLTTLFGSQAKASELLQAYGILGHKYAAAGGTNDAHPNYVIYDDSKISTNYVHFDKTSTGPTTKSAGDFKEAKDYLTQVTPWVKTALANISHAGEFTHSIAGDVIRLSTHALNPLSTAHHESAHAFFQKLSEAGATDVMDVLNQAAQSPHVMKQLREMLKNEPAALKQLSNPEERAAYMYQLHAAGELKLNPAATTIFGKIKDMVMQALGMWTNDARALHIMDYFQSGEYAKNISQPSAVHRALMEKGRNKAVEKLTEMAKPLSDLGMAVVGIGSQRLRDTGIPALREVADLIKATGREAHGDKGALPTSRDERAARMNDISSKLEGYTPEDMGDALGAMQRGVEARTAKGVEVQQLVQAALADTLKYMQKAGVDIEHIGAKDGVPYFPRVWDTDYISKNKADFMNMLNKYERRGELDSAQKLMDSMIARDGNEFGVENREPGMQFKKQRTLAFISHADAAVFMSKDLNQTLNSYITQATRRAEWSRRFADDGSTLDGILAKAKEQGATEQQLAMTEQYLKGVDGTLGDSIDPTYRRLMGNAIVYQNIRLLPLAIFSSVVDPIGLMVNGASAKEAWSTFKRGVREVPLGFKDQSKQAKDYWTEMTETLGVIDNATLHQSIGALYNQGMVGGTAQKINDTFFKLNLMEQYNRSMRIGATEAATRFIARHAKGESTHSERWLAELGLKASDIKLHEGALALTEAHGLSKAEADKMRSAVNQWVDGAILRPDAADKPIWMNDPRYMLISHLKQFVYSFHQTILKKVGHEFTHGNHAPVMAMASYVPIMIAADMMKGMIQGAGSQPEFKEGWGIGDYIWSGLQRAGIFGVGQFGIDVATDVQRGGIGIGALAGPTLGQMGDALELMGGHKEFAPFLLRAMPANALYGGIVKGDSEPDAVISK